MGKSKGGSKDYSAGGGKKWSIFLGIIVFVAIIVVVIILAIPPNTYNAVQTLTRSSQSTYLTAESEKVEYNKFKTKINSSVVNAYTTEIYNIEMLTGDVDRLLDYYNDYLIYAKDNKNLKNNYKAIKEGLNDAKESQRKIANIIEKTNKLSDESSSYLQTAMVDFREEYTKWLKSMKRAINGLENAYTGSLGKVSFNNEASKLILNTVNDYLTVILNNFQSLVKTDIKGANINTYKANYEKYGLEAKINLFHSFVAKHLDNAVASYDIENYYFDSTIQEKYELLNDFFEVYSEKNTQVLIESMMISQAQYNITKTYQNITDANGTFDAICKFIKGEN